MATAEELKQISINEFNKASEKYESDHAGVYELCKKDYPEILTELEKEPFENLLDCGCGPAPMLTLLTQKYPDKHYVGMDLAPGMIAKAKEKNLPNTEIVEGDSENMPFKDEQFDAIICSMSFHHYPNPDKFFSEVHRVLKPNGRLIIREMTMPRPILWFANNIEMPILNKLHYGDVRLYSLDDIHKLADGASLKVDVCEKRKGFRLHAVIRKP